MNLRNFKTVVERRKALEQELDVTLTNVGSFTLDESVASSRNCENMIGVAQVPMGVAGPLRIQAYHAMPAGRQVSRITYHDYYIPLATTEGALVASVNRGCKAITQNGGAVVRSERIGATRGPVFKVNNLEENRTLYEFIKTHLAEFKKIAEQTSHHLKFTSVSSQIVGKYQFVRFTFDTQDAMGLNMVTIATDPIVRFIEKATGAKCLALSGNYCVDKKPSWQNFINHRGVQVWAEVTLTQDVLKTILKTTAKEAYETWLAKCMIGSVMAGAMGFNAQYANVIAALFIATGQDPAHVTEGSLGITTCEVIRSVSFPRRRESMVENFAHADGSRVKPGMTEESESLYVSVYLPDLMVGTVGGGTGLDTQKEALELLGVFGGDRGNNALRFAEIVGAAVLAGEISLLSSLGEGTLASAHQKLARAK